MIEFVTVYMFIRDEPKDKVQYTVLFPIRYEAMDIKDRLIHHLYNRLFIRNKRIQVKL